MVATYIAEAVQVTTTRVVLTSASPRKVVGVIVSYPLLHILATTYAYALNTSHAECHEFQSLVCYCPEFFSTKSAKYTLHVVYIQYLSALHYVHVHDMIEDRKATRHPY